MKIFISLLKIDFLEKTTNRHNQNGHLWTGVKWYIHTNREILEVEAKNRLRILSWSNVEVLVKIGLKTEKL